jgi:hypothetical protein
MPQLWPWEDLVGELGRLTPRAWANWVGSLAASAETDSARERYRRLGASLVDSPRTKGN